MTSRARLADRIAFASAAVAVITAFVQDDRVSEAEAHVFQAVNDLPDDLYRLFWPVMQLGALGAAPATAAVAWMEGHRRMAVRLLLAGTATWSVAKVFKQVVRRPRPARLLPGTHVRGAEAGGLGYLSGHAGVSVALAAAALPECTPTGRIVIVMLVPVVGLSRMYVGAHLPLDVAAGAALGLAVGAAVQLLTGDGPAGPGRGRLRREAGRCATGSAYRRGGG